MRSGTATDKDGKPLTPEEQQARTNLVASLVAAIASTAGADASAATTATIIETENNSIEVNGKVVAFGVLPANATDAQKAKAKRDIDDYFKTDPDGQLILAAADGDQALATACLVNTGAEGCGALQAKLNGLREERTNTISRVSGGDAERREALSRLSPKELADLADFRERFDRLAPSEQQLVLEDFANPRTVTPDAILVGKAISAIFGEEALTEAYFDGVKLRSYGLGAAQTISETASPALRFLGDLALIGNEYNPDTGRRNPGYDTPEMQAELAAARQRINRTAADAAKNTGATASAIAQTLSDLRGPDWINPETGLEYYTPSQQQRDEYFARTKRGVDSVQAGTGAIVGSVVDPLAKAYDACVKGASARECGQATPGAAISATGVAGIARSAVVGVARSAAVRSLVGGAAKAESKAALDAALDTKAFPDGPASSAVNRERLAQQLAEQQAADLAKAGSDISDIRARVPLEFPDRPGNVAVADINITGISETRLAAHSQVDLPQQGLVGRSSGNFDFTTIPGRDGFLIKRDPAP